MSIVDLLDRFFESDQVKTVLALDGLIGTWAGPHEPGTGYVMAHHSIGDVGDGPYRGVGRRRRVAWARWRRRSRRARGPSAPTIRTSAPVDRILTRDGAVRGVALAGGEEIDAPIVVAATHPQITFLQSARARRPARGLRRRHPELAVAEWHREDQPGARPRARVHRDPGARGPDRRLRARALDRLPRAGFRGGARRTAVDRAVLGRRDADVARPLVAPEGKHIVSLFTQWVPRRVGETSPTTRSSRPTRAA